jgi:hypothetical protein
MAKKHPSLGVVFNDGSITMFYVHNKVEIEKRGLNHKQALGELMMTTCQLIKTNFGGDKIIVEFSM